jgi:hypothetical protein
MAESDYDALTRILGDVLKLEDNWAEGLIVTHFKDGTRLSFGCGEKGRLNMVAIQAPNPKVPNRLSQERDGG